MNIFETCTVVASLEKSTKIRDELTNANNCIRKQKNDKILKAFYAVYWILAPLIIACLIGLEESMSVTENFAVTWIENFATFLFIPGYSAFTGGIALAIFSIIRPIFKNKLGKRGLSPKEQEKYDENSARIYAAQLEINRQLPLLVETEVPHRYLCTYALRWMTEAIYNRRANSLQEAINLYEQHLAHLETIQAINNVSINYTVENHYWW